MKPKLLAILIFSALTACNSDNPSESTDSNSDETSRDGGSGSGGSGRIGQSCLTRNPSVTITENHGHVLSVPIGDVREGSGGSYILSFGNGHNHGLEISITDMRLLESNKSLSLETAFESAHSHTINLICAGKALDQFILE